jgi:hypothetical protein
VLPTLMRSDSDNSKAARRACRSACHRLEYRGLLVKPFTLLRPVFAIFPAARLWGLDWRGTMIPLFIAWGALILAVIGRALLIPLASRDQMPTEDEVNEEERARLEAIAMSMH